MATPVFCCGFEEGSSGTLSAHWTIGSTASITTGFFRSGLRSLHTNPAASAAAIATLKGVTLTNKTIVRFYVHFIALPSANYVILNLNYAGRQLGVAFKQSDSKVYIHENTTPVGTGVSVVINKWYRIDYRADTSGNPWLQWLSVDGAEVTSSLAVAAEVPASFVFGYNVSSTADVYIDDVLLSQTFDDYPLGPGYVLGYAPNADGTHTATSTNIVKGTTATPVGAAIVAGTTDANAWINRRPAIGGGSADATRLINAQTNAAAEYIEVKFEDSVQTDSIRAVELVTIDRQASTATGDFAIKLVDNATVVNHLNKGVVAGVVTDVFFTKNYPTAPSGGSWNLNASGNGSFQNLAMRFGYSSDANPDQYLRGAFIEVEYEPFIAERAKIFQQAVNRATNF